MTIYLSKLCLMFSNKLISTSVSLTSNMNHVHKTDFKYVDKKIYIFKTTLTPKVVCVIYIY